MGGTDMKKIICLLIIFKALSLELYAEGCQLPIGCENKAFPYKFCNSNNLFYKCSKNPYNEWDGATKLRPMKLDTCFRYDLSSYTLEFRKIEYDKYGVVIHSLVLGHDEIGRPVYGYKGDYPIYEIGTDTEITGYSKGEAILEPYETHIIHVTDNVFANFTYTDFFGDTCYNFLRFKEGEYPGTIDNFNDAVATWVSICEGCQPNDEDMQRCCVQFAWTKDPAEFKNKKLDPEKVIAFTSTQIVPPSIEPCNYDCNQMFVYLNQTNDFTGNTDDDPGNYKRHFFITGETSKKNWYSLKATFMHEMGHLFGFGDQYVGDSLDCDNSASIMSNVGFENPSRTLSDDDRCMYMKMYCWSPTSGINENAELQIDDVSVFPNPSNSNIINIQFDNTLAKDIDYEIVTSIGNVISKGHIADSESSAKLKTIEIKTIPAGVYYLLLKYNGKQLTKQLIINR